MMRKKMEYVFSTTPLLRHFSIYYLCTQNTVIKKTNEYLLSPNLT